MTKLKYIMSCNLGTNGKVTLLITWKYSEHGTKNRLQRLNKIYTKLWLKDEFLMILMKLRLGFHVALLTCFNILEYIWWLFKR